MKIQTSHFGEVVIDDSKVLFFENGMPGLEGDKRFALLSNEESKPINWLQSVDRKEIALPVLNPFLVCQDYSFDISNDDVSALGIKRVKDVYVLCVLVIPHNVNLMTINLSAPIIINMQNNKGGQIILDDRKYSVRTPVSELSGKHIKGGA